MKKKVAVILVTIWALAIGVGMVWITDYSTRPGEKSASPIQLPQGFIEENGEELPKLVLFLHPQCPCSRATLTELDRLVSKNTGLVDVRIFFYLPENQPPQWAQTDLWQMALEIPGAKLSTISEAELRRFGAITSGQVLLYNSQNKLVFSGGITKARGHEGDNPGINLIQDYLRDERTGFSETPVFGCILTTVE